MRMYSQEWEDVKNYANTSRIRDAAFELSAGEIPADHGIALYRELLRLLPWLGEVPGIGVHPVHGAPSGRNENLVVNRRVKLVLRLPVDRMDDVRALVGQRIDAGAGPLTIGTLKERTLTPFGTLYSHFVAGPEDEGRFLAEARSQLQTMDIACEMICGKQQGMTTPEGRVTGFSLMLHGLSPAQSILVQEQGLGPYREYGCGVFIPHKSIKEVAID